MAGEWREVRLGDLVDEGVLAISDGYRVRNEELGPEGIPFVRGGDIGDGWINTVTVDHIRPELAARVQAKLAGPGDVAFITKGTVGRAGRLRNGQPQVVFAPQVAYWRVVNRDALDPGFAFYLVRSQAFQAALDGVKTHGAMVADYVSISQQQDFRLRIPSIGSQRTIAHILGTLDDKIELNRRVNETLEAMARALFKSWFVDFDPVRAQAEGRDPGLPEEIADLFPDRFDESELGEIPAGWEAGAVGDLAEVSSGKRPDVGYPEASVEACVPLWGGNGPMAFVSKSLIDYPILLTGRVGTLGSVFRITSPCWPSDNTLILKATYPRAFEYLFLQLKRVDFASLNRGSTQPLLTQTDLKSQAVLLPPATVLERFHTFVKASYGRIDASEAESRTLAALRDTLLPKLISGELRVQDAETIAEAAI